MNIAVILAGGTGSRMRETGVPKQYRMVGGRPVISYCLDRFERHRLTDAILIVADEQWHGFLREWLKKGRISKWTGFAEPGKTRQHSIYNGLKKATETAGPEDVVIIHDAARPLVSEKIITDCLLKAQEADGAMPVIPVKDTVYKSSDGRSIGELLNRDELYAGQAPESFRLYKYMEAHRALTDEEIGRIRGSSEIAYLAGMEIAMVEGSEDNFKITTQEDLEKFILIAGHKEEE